MQYVAPGILPMAYEGLPPAPTHRDMVSNAFVFIHQTARQVNERLVKRGARVTSITPCHYLDCISHMVQMMLLVSITSIHFAFALKLHLLVDARM
jgi:dynein heavy chain 1